MFYGVGVLRYKSFHRNRILRTLLSLESQSHIALNGSKLSTSSKLNERFLVVGGGISNSFTASVGTHSPTLMISELIIFPSSSSSTGSSVSAASSLAEADP